MNRPSTPNLWTLVPALGVAQIISWGTLYYSLAVLGQSMQRDLGIGSITLFGAFTLSLVVSGLAAPRIGRRIDRRGARGVLAFGSALAALALFAIASSTGPITVIMGWMLAGCAMSATLYDPAFAALSQLAGANYRRALTALTLFGGFASTVFWPVSQFLLDAVGWRDALLIYAGLHVLVCLPLHLFLVPAQREREMPASASPPIPTGATGTDSAMPLDTGPAFVFLAAAFALSTLTFSALSVHLIAMLKDTGFDSRNAVWVAAMIGPMQVAGRILEFTVGRNLRPITVGLIALLLQILALILLAALPGPAALAFAFAAAYGCSNGIMTIARGAVPAELFGRHRYGELLGRFARVVWAANALAPVAVALGMEAGMSYRGIQAALTVFAALALLSYLAATRIKSDVIAAEAR